MGGKSSKPNFNNHTFNISKTCEDAINEVNNNRSNAKSFWNDSCKICECRNFILNNKRSNSFFLTFWEEFCKNTSKDKCVTYNNYKSNRYISYSVLESANKWNEGDFSIQEPFVGANYTKNQTKLSDTLSSKGNLALMEEDLKEFETTKLFASGRASDIFKIRTKAEKEAAAFRDDVADIKTKVEKHAYDASDAKIKAERHVTAAENAASDIQGKATAAENAKSEAERQATAAENAASDAQGKATAAKNAKLEAVTAQEGAQAAQEGSETILDDLNKDKSSGLIKADALNPIFQSSRINSDRRNLENIKSSTQNIIDSFMNMFNSNKEGFDVMNFFNAYVNNEEQRIAIEEKKLQNQINDVKKDQGLEFGALRNDIMGNILMDYMINEGDGSNVEKVYSKLNQENNDSLRKIQISNYYTKSYKAYIHLLKIILLAIAIIIPILIFNRLEIISKDITLFVVSIIILVTSIYCIYKIYLLYMKDPIDFDKIKIPEDGWKRSSSSIGSKRNYKDSPFKTFGITCIGDECCDGSMVYDNLRNKCIMKTQETQENFHNYFENAMTLKNSKNKIIEQSDSPELQKTFYYLGGNANVIEGLTTQDMLRKSLKISNNNDF